jgi:ketosteroid isomerase-like protein
LKQKLKIWVAMLTLVAMVGCNGQWASNGGGGGGLGRNKPRATEDEVRQQFEKLMGGFARRDIATINDMMASNATFINVQVGPGVYTWTDARPLLEQAFARGAYQLTNDAAYHIAVNRDLGWIATVYHVRVPGPNGLLQSDGGVSALFQKNADGYKVLMLHISRFAPVAPAVGGDEQAPAKAVPKK